MSHATARLGPLCVVLLRVAPEGLGHGPVGPPPVAPPLGLLSLAGALRRDGPPGVRVVVRNLATDTRVREDLEGLLRRDAPDLLGISALTFDEERMGAAARIAREVAPDVVVVAGGPLATLDPERCLDEPALDGVVVGEGEHTLVALVRALADGRDPAGTPGLHWRRADGSVHRGRRRAYEADLDALAPPAWDLVDLEHYSRLFNFHDLPPLQPPYAPVLTSRGCPWRCTYCHNLFGRRARLHSAARVLDDWAHLAEHHGVGEIHVVDDVFNVSRPRMRAICEGLVERGLDLRLAFPNGLRGDALEGADIARLQRAGCYSITFAVETASTRLQELIRKKLNVPRVMANARVAAGLGLTTSGYVMLGFPTETREEMEDTVAAVEHCALDLPRIFTVCPYPGTEMFDLAVAHGFDPGGRAGGDYDYDQAATNASPLSDEELAEVVRRAQARIYSNPPRLKRLERLLLDHPEPDSPFFQVPFWEQIKRRLGETAGPVGRPQTDALLLFPPVAPDFVYPEIGVPQLTAALRAGGATVVQRDLNAALIHRGLATREAMEAVLERPGWRRLLMGGRRGVDAAESLLRAYRRLSSARRTLLLELVQAWDLAPPTTDLDEVLTWAAADHPRLDRLLGAELADVLASGPPAVAGLSVCTATQLGPALRLAHLLQRAGCGAVLLGGPWARAAREALPGWGALFDVVDGVAIGEAERTLTEALEVVRWRGDLSRVPGLAVRRDGEVVVNPEEPPQPVPAMPAPDFDGLELSLYPRRWLPVRTRRGCPWGRCVFCHHVHAGAGDTRGDDGPTLSASEAVDRMEALHRAHGISTFELANLSTPAAELLALADEIAARGLSLTWHSLARVEPALGGDALARLARGGCRGLALGLESAAAVDLRRVRKGIDVAVLDDVLAAAAGVPVELSLFVLGIPGQRSEDLDETLAFCLARREQLQHVTMQPFRLGLATAAWAEPDLLGLAPAEDALRSVDVFDLPHRAADTLPYEAFVQRATAVAMALARRDGAPDPTLWDVRDLVARIRGDGPPGAAAGEDPAPRALVWDLDDSAGWGPERELGLLAGVLPRVLVLRARARDHAAIQRLTRFARILRPSCTVVVVGPAAARLDRAPYDAVGIDLWWTGEGEEDG